MPPLSFVSSVYCASPSASFARSFESADCSSSVGGRPLDVELAHVRDVEDTDSLRDREMLGDHALVLDGHLPPGEGDEARAGGDVAIVERCSPKRHGRVHENGL